VLIVVSHGISEGCTYLVVGFVLKFSANSFSGFATFFFCALFSLHFFFFSFIVMPLDYLFSGKGK